MSLISGEEEQRLAQRYLASGSNALIDAEIEVLGSDYRANGYTTRTQADELGRLLDLEPGTALLDLGAGCGWPGLYLAERSGCDVASYDPMHEGLDVSRARAKKDGIESRHLAVRGHGDALPFRSRSFGAVVHTDVLC